MQWKRARSYIRVPAGIIGGAITGKSAGQRTDAPVGMKVSLSIQKERGGSTAVMTAPGTRPAGKNKVGGWSLWVRLNIAGNTGTAAKKKNRNVRIT